MCCHPLIIFMGNGESKLMRIKTKKYHPVVMIETAFKFAISTPDRDARLVIVDTFKGQCNSEVVHTLRNWNSIIGFVPGGCMGLIQPLDIAINAPLKNNLCTIINIAVEKDLDHWYNTAEFKKDAVVSISKDHEIKISDLGEIAEEIGDWREGGLYCNLKNVENIETKHAKMVKVDRVYILSEYLEVRVDITSENTAPNET
ncbi:hypothetical protein L873DRAFT_1849700 [Choiromyces venosus 120613-1]|uniref:DDE-1 domain-containing protein n=1 Tax=Choiromyces venosus 120613-1 TaxID=1336337 RepID=A0A3N4IUM8_9PEZI|nr:hypothetical protein L873DRAFT_1849700 [Choiromyces venosus 120613-1]